MKMFLIETLLNFTISNTRRLLLEVLNEIINEKEKFVLQFHSRVSLMKFLKRKEIRNNYIEYPIMILLWFLLCYTVSSTIISNFSMISRLKVFIQKRYIFSRETFLSYTLESSRRLLSLAKKNVFNQLSFLLFIV